MCSAVAISDAFPGGRAASPVAFAIGEPETIARLGNVAVSEGIVDVIGSAGDHNNDNDNDDDDDQKGDTDAERAADTAGAESSLGGLGSFVT